MLLIPLVALGLATLVVPALEPHLGRRTGYVLAVVFGGLAALVAAQGPAVLGGDPIATTVPWFPTIDVGLSLRLDGTGWLFAMLVLVGCLSILLGLVAELTVRTYYESQGKRTYALWSPDDSP